MGRKALFIGTVWPEPESSAAGVRTMGLLRTLQGAGWKIAFLSPSIENKFSEALTHSGVDLYPMQANDPRFDLMISELKPEIAIFDRFIMEEQFGWRIREHSAETVTVLDTSDLHFLRRARQRALDSGESQEKIFNADLNFSSANSFAFEDALREVGSIYRSDLTLIISSFEMELLIKKFKVPGDLLLHLPFFMKSPDLTSLPSFGDRKHFVSIGNFRHAPNADGVQWFRNKIWPQIRAQLAGVEAHMYGSYPSREIMALSKPEVGFFIKGPADHSIQTLKRYRINLAALRFGAGIKGKVADGWCAGTPAVTTPIGAEGMLGDSGEFAGRVACTESEFAQQCIELYRNEIVWKSVQALGFQAREELLDEEKNAKAFLARLRCAIDDRDIGREKNFVGSMLRHHLHQSTKYFSKWIEAKNRVI